MIHIVVKDFMLFTYRYRAGDLFDTDYWPDKLVRDLVAEGRIDQVVVYEDEEEFYSDDEELARGFGSGNWSSSSS